MNAITVSITLPIYILCVVSLRCHIVMLAASPSCRLLRLVRRYLLIIHEVRVVPVGIVFGREEVNYNYSNRENLAKSVTTSVQSAAGARNTIG